MDPQSGMQLCIGVLVVVASILGYWLFTFIKLMFEEKIQ